MMSTRAASTTKSAIFKLDKLDNVSTLEGATGPRTRNNIRMSQHLAICIDTLLRFVDD